MNCLKIVNRTIVCCVAAVDAVFASGQSKYK